MRKILSLLSIKENLITYTSTVFESEYTFDNIISTIRINKKHTIYCDKIIEVTNFFNSSEFSKPGRIILLRSKFGYGSISPRTTRMKSIISKLKITRSHQFPIEVLVYTYAPVILVYFSLQSPVVSLKPIVSIKDSSPIAELITMKLLVSLTSR